MNRPIYLIATEIRKDWGGKTNYAAKPYLEAMASLTNVTDSYGQDNANGIICRFLSNASTWRGETAKRVKTELKGMVGLK